MSRCDLILVVAAAFAVLVTVCIQPCWTCSPTGMEEEKTIQQQVEEAPLVLYGRVLRTIDLPHLNYGGDMSAYKAEMVVYCSLKKPVDMEVSAVLNITEVGIIPGHCFMTTLEPREEYVVLVRLAHDGQLKPWQSTHAALAATPDNIREVKNSCGLEPQESIVSQMLLDAGMDPSSLMKPCFEPAEVASCGGGETPAPESEAEGEGEDSHDHGSHAEDSDEEDDDTEDEAGKHGQDHNAGVRPADHHYGVAILSTISMVILGCYLPNVFDSLIS